MDDISKKYEWNEFKIEFLKTYYPFKSNREIAEFLKISADTIIKKATEMGLKKQDKKWTKEMDDYLHEHYADHSFEEMMAHLDKTKGSIITHASALGLKRNTFIYIKEINAFLENNYNGYNLHDLAKKIGSTSMSVKTQLTKLKIYKKIPITEFIKEKRKEFIEELNKGKFKTCKKCGNVFENPILHFYLYYYNSDGLHPECKNCYNDEKRMIASLKTINEQVKKEERWKKEISNNIYHCKVCNGTFKGGDMSIAPSIFKVRPYCKPCHNKQKKEQRIERMMKKARGEM